MNKNIEQTIAERAAFERANRDYSGKFFKAYLRRGRQLTEAFFEVNGIVFERKTGKKVAMTRFQDAQPTIAFKNDVLREDWVVAVLRKVDEDTEGLDKFKERSDAFLELKAEVFRLAQQVSQVQHKLAHMEAKKWLKD